MRKSLTLSCAAAILLAFAAPMLAGGFFIVLGNPDASAEARAVNAVLTIKSAGCHQPEKAEVTATAIGLVNGRRESVALKLVRLPEPGMYAITRQWPSDGKWVLQFVGTDQGRITTTLVAAGPGGIERQTARSAPGQPNPAEIAALLGTAQTVARK